MAAIERFIARSIREAIDTDHLDEILRGERRCTTAKYARRSRPSPPVKKQEPVDVDIIIHVKPDN